MQKKLKFLSYIAIIAVILSGCTTAKIITHYDNSIEFKIEKLSPPERLLKNQTEIEIYEQLICEDEGFYGNNLDKRREKINAKIISYSTTEDSLVNFGYHAFLGSIETAYAEHRPVVISPDMIWLLISQGFAKHVENNAEKLRHHFVDFEGKQEIILKYDKYSYDDPRFPWKEVIAQFSNELDKRVGKNLADIIRADFSTTTSTELVASEITLMKSMDSYFSYTIGRLVCGIPSVTLQGTPEDWERVLFKAKALKQYDLDWWIDELDPVLKNIIKSSQGEPDRKFWMNMFKYHNKKQYGGPSIDGWIIKFFPYDNDGLRNKFKEIRKIEDLPEEIVKVDVMFLDEERNITQPLKVWAGFIGAEQNEENFALTPNIGWMVKKDDDFVDLIMEKNLRSMMWNSLKLTVSNFPEELLSIGDLYETRLDFSGDIDIPEEIKDIRVKQLILFGEIDEAGIDRIKTLLPKTDLWINNNHIQEDVNDCINLFMEKDFSLINSDNYWIINVSSTEFLIAHIDVFKKLEAEIINIAWEYAVEDLEVIKASFPNAKIYYDCGTRY